MNHSARSARMARVVGIALLVVGALGWIVTRQAHLLYSNHLAATLLIAGLLLTLYAQLARHGRDVDEAYRLGYDLGYEAGHRDRDDSNGRLTSP